MWLAPRVGVGSLYVVGAPCGGWHPVWRSAPRVVESPCGGWRPCGSGRLVWWAPRVVVGAQGVG